MRSPHTLLRAVLLLIVELVSVAPEVVVKANSQKRAVGSKRGNQIHRNVFGSKAPSLITECRERLQCIEVAPNRRRFQTSRLAIGQVILDRLINSFSLYGVDSLLRLEHRRKHPLAAGPIASLHRLARTH